ncbi:MAG TPA: hypothetical protein VNT02_01160 [Burkholderiales bacterium]|nr:hypothetical protein [Burkholderiales bacterium]
MCSTAFVDLGRAQQSALGAPDLPIAVVPHPFGTRRRDDVRAIAEHCAGEIARLACESKKEAAPGAAAPVPLAQFVEAPADLEALNDYFMQRKWGDGLVIVPPTRERVERMLAHTARRRDEVVASIAPRYGAATVERIAINAVMAGCKPEYLPVVIAAAQAVAVKAFHLQAIQATTNPAAVWLVVNGPIAQRLGINSGGNCLGPGAWANGTLGRALRLVLQNIGGGLPGDMDKATHGQPGKWTFCCAENEAANPWEPLHVERGHAPDESTVTVVGALGTWNMNITAKEPENVVAMIGDTMQYPASSDYIHGGAPWVVLSPQHAQLFAQAGWSKAEVKRRLWEASKMRAGRSLGSEFERLRTARAAELGDITADTMLPISVQPGDITILVAGGAGSHALFVPVSAHTRSVTVKVDA